MNTKTSNTFSTIGRSLHVFLLATIGLVFYLASFALLLLVCGLIVSACVRAEVPVRQPAPSTSASCGAAPTSLPGQASIAGADVTSDCIESPR
jgi:hypothetical protein